MKRVKFLSLIKTPGLLLNYKFYTTDFSTLRTKKEYVNKMPSEERVLFYFSLFFPLHFCYRSCASRQEIILGNWYY